MRLLFSFTSLLCCLTLVLGLTAELERDVVGLMTSDNDGRHTNNWAVLVCTSRYWFNYRVRRTPFGSGIALIVHYHELRGLP